MIGQVTPHLQRVCIGGSAAPRSMLKRFYDQFGAVPVHAWGEFPVFCLPKLLSLLGWSSTKLSPDTLNWMLCAIDAQA
jgi:hypothetical protein